MPKFFYLIFVFVVLWGFFFKDLLFYIYECFAYLYVCELYVSGTHGFENSMSDPLELEL